MSTLNDLAEALANPREVTDADLEALQPPEAKKPAVRLSSGNGYAILMKCADAAEKADWSWREWRTFSRKFRSGTYEEALTLVARHFEMQCLPSFSTDPANWKTSDESPVPLELT